MDIIFLDKSFSYLFFPFILNWIFFSSLYITGNFSSFSIEILKVCISSLSNSFDFILLLISNSSLDIGKILFNLIFLFFSSNSSFSSFISLLIYSFSFSKPFLSINLFSLFNSILLTLLIIKLILSFCFSFFIFSFNNESKSIFNFDNESKSFISFISSLYWFNSIFLVMLISILFKLLDSFSFSFWILSSFNKIIFLFSS